MAEGYFQKRRRARGVWLLPPLLLVVLYLLAFPVPGGQETYVRPAWAVGFAETGPLDAYPPGVQPGEAFPFRVGELFGYATPQGALLYVGRVLSGVTLSRAGFINYGQVPDHFVFMNPLGQMSYSLASSGYPLLADEGRVLYALATDLAGIRRIDESGEVLWSAGFASHITAISCSGQECVVGLLEGRLVSMGPQGEVLYQERPAQSRIPVLLGVAADPGGTLIAAVAGIDPQRLLLIQRQGPAHTPRLDLELASDLRREVLLRFSDEGRFLYVEGSDGLQVLEVRRGRLTPLPVSGRLQALAGGGVLTAVAVQGQEGARLVLLRPLRTVLCEAPLDGRRPFLRLADGVLYVGVGGYLLRADIVSG